MSSDHFFSLSYKTLVINSSDLDINGYYNLLTEIPYSGVRLAQLLFCHTKILI